MRIRTALSAALVSLAAVITLSVTGPGPEANDTAADPLVIVAAEPEVTWPAPATDRLTHYGRVAPWECALSQPSTGDQ